MARLAEWRNPDTGEAVVARAWRREDVYHGPAVEDAPDIVLEPALDQGYAYTYLSSRGQPGPPVGRLAPAERLGAKGGSMNGSHRPEGILILAGSGVQRGNHLAEAQIIDVAPTLLHLLGLPLPAHLDGRVLSEALAPGGEVLVGPGATGTAQVADPYSAERAAMVDQRLRGLGYRM
jgi:predicted AlkP superfamily phosphohydrolase/phosphomutase